MTVQEKVVNGIDQEAFSQLVDTVKQNPELAQFKFRAENTWIGGSKSVTVISDYYGAGQEREHSHAFTLEADEPRELAGTDSAPNATEALLYALASCINATMIYGASAQGIHFDKLELDLEGQLDTRGLLDVDKSVRRGFSRITVKCRIKADVGQDQLDQLCDFAKSHSPVFDIVSNPTPIDISCQPITE
jgi:uncharacterized OsmC-like protein